MRNPFERPVQKGLVSGELRNLRAKSKKTEELEDDVKDELRISIWNVHDTPLKELFEGGHIAEEESFEGLGVTGDDVGAWVSAQQAKGMKIATLDVMGQTRAGLETGANRAHAWSLADVRHWNAEIDPKEEITEGDIFRTGPRKEVLDKLDIDKSENGTELGVVFFRPVAGVKEMWGSKYGQLYLYEFILRPLYERLVDGGMVFMSSQYLAGMPLLGELLKHSDGVQFVSNEKKNGYMLRKKSPDSRLTSLADMDEGSLLELSRQFEDLKLQKEDETISAIKDPAWRLIRRAITRARRTLIKKS